jgi:hypothetical protein
MVRSHVRLCSNGIDLVVVEMLNKDSKIQTLEKDLDASRVEANTSQEAQVYQSTRATCCLDRR